MMAAGSMVCNNCGAAMMRSAVVYNASSCHSCGMRHIWPDASPSETERLRNCIKAIAGYVECGDKRSALREVKAALLPTAT